MSISIFAWRSGQRIVRLMRLTQPPLQQIPFARFPRSWSLRQLVEIFDKRHHRAVEALDLWVRRFDNVIFVRRMRAASVAESEMSGRQLKRFTGEDVTGIRTGVARPEQRVDSEVFVSCQLRLDQCRIF